MTKKFFQKQTTTNLLLLAITVILFVGLVGGVYLVQKGTSIPEAKTLGRPAWVERLMDRFSGKGVGGVGGDGEQSGLNCPAGYTCYTSCPSGYQQGTLPAGVTPAIGQCERAGRACCQPVGGYDPQPTSPWQEPTPPYGGIPGSDCGPGFLCRSKGVVGDDPELGDCNAGTGECVPL